MGAWVETRDDTYNNSILTAIFVLTGIFVLIYIPFCCYCSYRLHASRDEAFIKVRKSILSHIIIINSILFILQRLIVTDYLYCIGFNECLYHNYHLSSFLSPPKDGSAASNTIEMSEIFPNINAFFNILWLVSCTPKIFWVWYELSLQNAFSNQEWWRQINDKLGENIFIKYHNNIYTYSAVALMLYVIISIFICYLFNTFGQFVIYGLTSIIIIIALPLMLYKLPQIDDIFYLRLELNECIILYIPMIIFFNISTIFIYNPSQIWHIVDIAVFMISNAILCYIVTIRPINLLFEAKSSSKLELTAKSSNHSPIQSSIKSQPNKPTPVALSYKAHSRSNSTTTPTHSTRLQYQHSANSKPNSRQNSPRYGSQSNMNNINLKVSCDILESEIIEYNENLSHPNTNPMSYQYSNPKDSFCGTIDENTEISAEHDEKYYEESMQISIRSQTSNKPLPAALTNGNISASPSFSIDDAIPKTWSGWISKSTDNFNRFMQTLTAELAVENLLFIIEVTQYKRKIIKKIIKLQDGGGRKSPVSLSRNNSSRNNDRGFPNIDTNAPNSRSVSRTEQSISTHAMQQFSSKTGIMTALPSNVPKSPIVYNKAKLSLHHQIVMLYQKYIDIDAPLSINLSAETRDRLDKKLTTILKLPPTPITVSSSHGIMQTLDIMRQTTATSTNTNTTATTKTVTPNTFTSSTMSRSHYEEPELWGLLLVFDDCITELYRLLNSSWKRLREKLKKEMTIPMEEVMRKELERKAQQTGHK